MFADHVFFLSHLKQDEFVSEILQGYANYSLPLTHVMLDVDWHTEDSGNSTVPCYSYGGYTVRSKAQKQLFF